MLSGGGVKLIFWTVKAHVTHDILCTILRLKDNIEPWISKGQGKLLTKNN